MAGVAEPSLAHAAGTARGRTIAVVLNSKSGALLASQDALGGLTELFAKAGLAATLVPLDAGTLPERVALACAMQPDAVVVAGGDGTIACAAQLLAGSFTPLGILPFGTMNLLAKDLGIPAGDPEQAIAIIAAGNVRKIDAAEVNGRVFLLSSILGLPVSLGRFRETQRTHVSGVRLWSRLGLAFLRQLRRYLPPRYVVEANVRSSVVRAPAITITVNAVDEPGGRSFGRAHLDCGELFAYVVTRLRVSDALRLAVGWLRGAWRSQAAISEFRSTVITLRTRRRALRVMNDGEIVLLKPPLEYRIRPRSLRVLAPPASPGPSGHGDA